MLKIGQKINQKDFASEFGHKFTNKDTQKARSVAKNKHKGQFRKDSITPYSKHLGDVVKELKSMGITNDDILCAGWLHDTIEDTEHDEIYKNFNKKNSRLCCFSYKRH